MYDTEEDEVVETEILTETEAELEAGTRSRDHVMDHLYGFPFAQSTGYVIQEYEIDAFADAGFLVWNYKGGELIIAGIDGGGYSFLAAHWFKLYWHRATKYGWKIMTGSGYRRVA